MSNCYEQTADEIYARYTAARKDAVTFTINWLHQIYVKVTGGNNKPRTEAKKHIAEVMWKKYQLVVSYGDHVLCVHPDRNFSPG